MSFTIILPIYGDSPWLDEAVQSILDQQSRHWKLLIADDGADETAHKWLKSKINEINDERVEWKQRQRNLGLFANLNQAIAESDTDWITLLCSDDRLHKNAIEYLIELQNKWPQADLIISSFESINANGTLRPAVSSDHHNELRMTTGLVHPKQMLPELLRLGSLNGNLTGMAFKKTHWLRVGPFKENWRHAADWEWLIRASERKPLLLNRKPLASVRTHDRQLSVRNRRSGHECQEVAAVVTRLLKHPLLKEEANKYKWAGHVMQFQLWNLLKQVGGCDSCQVVAGLRAIHESAGIRQTTVSLIGWIPRRWKRRFRQSTN